jgi:HlyD family secretion protein
MIRHLAKAQMLKYAVVICVIIAVTGAISIIDARSTGVIAASQSADKRASRGGTIFATGIIEGATEAINLRAEQFGRVRDVLVTAGQWVDAGQVLVRLDDSGPQQDSACTSAKLELAKAELERVTNGARREERDEAHAHVRAAQARLDQAVRDLERIQSLWKEHAVTAQEADDHQALVATSRAELEAAEARARQIEAPARADELRAAVARVSAAQAELNLANIHRAKCEVRAPQRGRVLDRHVEPGELTGPDAHQPLVVLSDTSTVRVRAYVEELDAPRVRIGMSARVTADGLPNSSYTGRVVSVSPRMVSKVLHSDHPSEMYDSKTREVLLEMSDMSDPIMGLRVDVEFSRQFPASSEIRK